MRSQQTREEMRNDPDFREKVSSASCNLDSIKAIVFGGFSSRFWVYRKHINGLKKSQLEHLPFYSWQCITLQLSNRDIDLVIPHDPDMNMLLKLLNYKMCSLNGAKDTAKKLIE